MYEHRTCVSDGQNITNITKKIRNTHTIARTRVSEAKKIKVKRKRTYNSLYVRFGTWGCQKKTPLSCVSSKGGVWWLSLAHVGCCGPLLACVGHCWWAYASWSES